MNKKIKISIIIIAIIILAISVVIGLSLKSNIIILGNTKKVELYEEPVKNMIEGIQNLDENKYNSAFPEFIKYKITKEQINEIMNNYIQMCGEDIKISYEIVAKEDISENNLKVIQDNIKIYYDHTCSVTKGYRLEVKRIIKGKDSEQEIINPMKIYEIEGKWYSIAF
ncbi:MAG TPA: hypothetical protein PK993_00915 [Clostridia bacterium]|nr:hypothetical protein [Clostridia bacterium]